MLDPSQDTALKERLANGFIVETMDDMTPGYMKALKTQMLVQGDTELMSAPAYYMAAKDAPTISSRIAVSAVIQDELGHANIAYRLLEDLGEDKEQLVFGRAPNEFKNPYGFDQALENWAEMAVANGFFDRAGIVLLSDVHQNTSYGPLKRALVKVDKEEYFHLRHGESWMRRLSKAGGEVKELLQKAVDWMFPTSIEWFGLPDEMKRHTGQLSYRLKGKTNDELRQTWMASVVPLCAEVGVDVPAHYDEATGTFEVEYELPCQFDPDAKRWLFDEPITWDEVWERWRARGPMNERYVEMIQGRGDTAFGRRAGRAV
ncbi:MAG TPA: Phenylacetic acid catabolic protein [Gemmatimonadota bacterium]|nr:Phenylacetic acid catabolic protein [Gemmatimonadota bacterium]